MLYLAPGGRQVISFGLDDTPARGETQAEWREAALRRMSEPPPGQGRRRRSMRIERVDGEPVSESALAPLLLRCGFVKDYRGFTLVTTP